MNDLTETDIWDAHVHLLPPRRTRGLVRWIKRTYPEHPSREDYTPEDILEELSACGVSKVFSLVFPLQEEETWPLNRFSRETGELHPEVVPFGSMHIETPRKDQAAERCVGELGLAGIKLHGYAQRFETFCEEFDPLYRKLDELNRPLLVHTGFDSFYGMTQDLDYLVKVLEEYPGMPLVLVHSLFPRFKLAYELASRYPQLYLDVTNVLSSLRYMREAPPGHWSEHLQDQRPGEALEYFDGIVDELHSRVMFGTDHPAGMDSPSRLFEDFDYFDFAPEVRRDLLKGTASRFHRDHCGGQRADLEPRGG